MNEDRNDTAAAASTWRLFTQRLGRAVSRPLHVAMMVSVAVATGSDRDAAAANPAAADSLLESEYWQSPDSPAQEKYVDAPMPPGIQVIVTELEGPVYADARGRTLYIWPLKDLRNGSAGDRPGTASQCTDEVLRVSSGFMSPYPSGALLPDLERRPSCADLWPPLLAEEDDIGFGKWTIVPRQDGSPQWAYEGYPVYTSAFDERPGDVRGGTKLDDGGDAPAVRDPIGPPPAIPAQFQVIQTATGRLITTEDGYSVYASDLDEPGKSNCREECLTKWAPVPAPQRAREHDDWTIVERSSGINQWAFRGQSLYTYIPAPRTRGLMGSDELGWHNVYTQRALPPPAEFTIQDNAIGQVLADSHGKTVYLYNCGDDSLHQLACNHPSTTQAYRLAICGNGDPELCRKTFPYVIAPADARSVSRLWSVITIDPETGHFAAPGQPRALHVWAYRDRPVYTYFGDEEAGDDLADAFGEHSGYRNGFKAFYVRDDYVRNTFTGFF